jgi:hypothetical protein
MEFHHELMIASFYAGRSDVVGRPAQRSFAAYPQERHFYGTPKTVQRLSFPLFISQPRYNFSSPTEFTPHAGLV